MKALRIAALLIVCCPAWGAYPWYLSDNFTSFDTSKWSTLQGSPQASVNGGGLFAWNNALIAPLNAPPGGWADYEIQGTVTGCGGSKTYSLYARMSQDATSYYVLSVGSCTQYSATITLAKVVSGVWTTFTSFPSYHRTQYSSMLARLIVRQNKIIAWVDSAGPYIAYDNALPAGQPGVGLNGSGGWVFSIANVNIGPADTVPPNPVDPSTITAATIPTGVNLLWPATSDDSNGIGLGDTSCTATASSLVPLALAGLPPSWTKPSRRERTTAIPSMPAIITTTGRRRRRRR